MADSTSPVTLVRHLAVRIGTAEDSIGGSLSEIDAELFSQESSDSKQSLRYFGRRLSVDRRILLYLRNELSRKNDELPQRLVQLKTTDNAHQSECAVVGICRLAQIHSHF